MLVQAVFIISLALFQTTFGSVELGGLEAGPQNYPIELTSTCDFTDDDMGGGVIALTDFDAADHVDSTSGSCQPVSPTLAAAEDIALP